MKRYIVTHDDPLREFFIHTNADVKEIPLDAVPLKREQAYETLMNHGEWHPAYSGHFIVNVEDFLEAIFPVPKSDTQALHTGDGSESPKSEPASNTPKHGAGGADE